MTATDRILAWLRDAMDAAQRGAEAATPGPWAPKAADPGDDEVYTRHDGEHGDLVGDVVAYVRGQEFRRPSGQRLANMHLIATHADPDAVLCRIAADRKLLDDLLAETHDVVEDCWYTCAAATEEADGGETCDDNRRGKPCDCGRDARVTRRVQLLAEAWGWAEAAS
ncbi:DUF6221 family protein [Streptomyces sp. NPDC001205]